MLSIQRLEKVRDYILQNKYANINELAELFGTSAATIRRCLKQLEQEKLVESVRGGAVLISKGSIFEPPYMIKKKQNESEKKRIAEEACRYINANSSIFLDASTTVYEISHFMQSKKNISICTNDVYITCALNNLQDVCVTVTGGVLRNGYYTLSGFYAEKMLSEMQLDYAFMAVDAITDKGKFTITNTEELGIKRAAVQAANHTIVLCDHSKFKRTALLSLWEPEKVDLIITGKELGEEMYQEYTDMGFTIKMV